MFSLRSPKSDRSLRKLKKPKFSLSSPPLPEVDFVAFRNALPVGPVRPPSLPVTTRHTRPPCSLTDHRPSFLQAPTATRRSRCISNRGTRRDTILIDLTNNDDLIPALDYAFAILDESSAPPSSNSNSDSNTTNTSSSSSTSSDVASPPMPSTPLSFSSCRPPSPFISTPLSVRSAPPRYHHVATLPAIEDASPLMVMCHPHRDDLFSPSSSPSHVRGLSTDSASPPPLPFPPSPEPSPFRVPLLQRKPRILHSPESSIDSHDPFIAPYVNASKVSLVRSPSSLDHRKDPFFYYYPGTCPSSASVNTMPDSQLVQLLAGQTTPRSSSSSLKIFPSPKTARRSLIRRASTPHSVRPNNTQHAKRPSPRLDILLGFTRN